MTATLDRLTDRFATLSPDAQVSMTHLRVIPGWVDKMKAAVDGAKR